MKITNKKELNAIATYLCGELEAQGIRFDLERIFGDKIQFYIRGRDLADQKRAIDAIGKTLGEMGVTVEVIGEVLESTEGYHEGLYTIRLDAPAMIEKQ